MKRLRLVPLMVLSGILTAAAWSQTGPKIVVAGLSPTELSELRAAARANYVAVSDAGAALREISDADALLGMCSQELVHAGKKLRWIQVYSAGVDRYRFPELLDSDITLTNVKILQGPEIADHAQAAMNPSFMK